MKGIPSWDFNVTFCIVSFKIISTPLFQLQAHVQFQGFNFSLHVRLCEFPRLPDDVFLSHFIYFAAAKSENFDS